MQHQTQREYRVKKQVNRDVNRLIGVNRDGYHFLFGLVPIKLNGNRPDLMSRFNLIRVERPIYVEAGGCRGGGGSRSGRDERGPGGRGCCTEERCSFPIGIGTLG